MINDSVDILDAFIINIGIEFEAVIDPGANKYAVLRRATQAIENEFKIHKEISRAAGKSKADFRIKSNKRVGSNRRHIN